MKIKTAVWQDLRTEDLSDIPNIREQISGDCLSRYSTLLHENGLDPELHEPDISYEESETMLRIIIGVKPVKRIGSVPINQVKFTD